MIEGKLVETYGNVGLIDTGYGVAFEVFLPPALLSEKRGERIRIYTYLAVKENSLTLFGFKEKRNVMLFNSLISISGIGPKLAFAVLSFLKYEEIIDAVRNNDAAFLSQVPGLGKKTAMKIILELSSRLEKEVDIGELTQTYVSEDDKIVMEALISLGFKRNEVRRILGKLDRSLSVEERVRKALSLLR